MKEQPKEVRMTLANSFAASISLTTEQYFSILKVLADDPDKDIAQIVDRELGKHRHQDELLDIFSNEFSKAIDEFRSKERQTLLNLLGQRPQMIGLLADSINKHRQDMFGQLSGKTFAPIIGSIGTANLKPIREILKPIPSYYPASELSVVERESQIPPHSEADSYIRKLFRCKPGKKNWKEYQDICREILTYCLVPPLMEPSEQSRNLAGRHRRDFVFQIPHSAGTFWDWIIFKYGLGIVVECKNYTNPLKENEVMITSKYLGRKKLITLGMILTRKGLSKNAQQTQIDKWKDDDILIICLNDDDLAKMLELGEKSQDPGKVIDNATRKLLERM